MLPKRFPTVGRPKFWTVCIRTEAVYMNVYGSDGGTCDTIVS